MSILGEFVPNFECYLSRRILKPRWYRLQLAIMIDHRKKHKTLSYLSVLAVIGSRMCTMSAVCSSRGVQPESLLPRTSLQMPVKETICSS